MGKSQHGELENASGESAAVVLSSVFDDRRLALGALPGLNVEFCTLARDAIAVLEKTRAPALLARLRDAGGTLTRDLACEVLARAPRFTVVALAAAADLREDQILVLTQLGIADVCVDADPRTGARLAFLVEEASFLARQRAFAARCVEGLEPKAASLMRDVMEHGGRPRTAAEFRASVGIRRSSLERRVWKYFSLQPHELNAWGRLASATLCLEGSLASMEGIANDLDFASESALHNEFQRYLQMTGREVVEAGGSEYLLSRLREHFPKS